jgi:hypothetical protein
MRCVHCSYSMTLRCNLTNNNTGEGQGQKGHLFELVLVNRPGVTDASRQLKQPH